MARPKHETPTAGELEILHVLWERGPSTVREVHEELSRERKRAYTSVMSLMNIMVDKKLVTREPQGRAFVYCARQPREATLGRIVQGVLGRAFSGSAHQLVAHLLNQTQPSSEELDEIRRVISDYERQESE